VSYLSALKATAKALPFGVALGCLAASLVFTLFVLLTEPGTWKQWLIAPVGALIPALFAAGFAVLPAFLFGLPAYAWLLATRRAAWWSASLLGAFGGVLVGCWAGWEMAVLTGGYGLCVGYFTHEAYRAGANNSSKPTPLRGAA